MNWTRRAGTLLLGVLWGMAQQPTHATVRVPPPPIVIPFGPGDSRVEGEAAEALDRLIVRALHCPEGGQLTLTVHHLQTIDKALLARREAAIRGRISALGLSMGVQRETVDVEATAAWPPDDKHKVVKHWFLAGSARAEDDLCFEDGGLTVRPSPRLLPWLAQLKTALQGQPFQAPLFWQRLSPNVRRAQLSPALARLAHEQAQAGDVRARAVFWWLVDEEARRMPPPDRLQWVLYLWASGTDADLLEIQRRLSIGGIDLNDRAHRAVDLVMSNLSWSVVERRLSAPGLMQRIGQIRDHGVDLVQAVEWRGEWVAWGRLVRQAGPARACFLEAAVGAYAWKQSTGRYPGLAHLDKWVGGPPGRYEGCDPSATLLAIGAGCALPEDFDLGMPAIWLEAGLVLDPESVARALSPAGVRGDGECQLEAAPSERFPFRRRKL